MRVLIVEDEIQLADIIGRVLRREQYDVDIAHDGVAGLDLALTGSYDAIVLDRLLPGLDGMEVCRQLRAEAVDTPVLILSALRDMPERVEGLDAGADDYLGKPFALAELVARVRALILQLQLVSESCQSSLVVTPSGDGLMPSAPVRPLQAPLWRRDHGPHQPAQQPAHFRHGQRDQLAAATSPFSPACSRITVSMACANMAKVMCRYQPAHLRTSY
jgi:CheY-like chemotaxis protein